MKRNVSVWKNDSNQWVIEFSDDLTTVAIWTTGPGVDFTRVVSQWVDNSIIPGAARRIA